MYEQIQSGELAPESRVPTEKELSEKYQVSRITSKRALTELEQNQLIYRIQGSGSFVRRPIQPQSKGKCCLFYPSRMTFPWQFYGRHLSSHAGTGIRIDADTC